MLSLHNKPTLMTKIFNAAFNAFNPTALYMVTKSVQC